MGRLFKIGSEKAGVRGRRGTPTDWCCKIKLGVYDQKRARLCTDAAMSESWAVLLQAAVDRKIAGEPADPDALKRLPRRLLESFGLVSELSAKRKGTYAENVKDYVSELKTAGRSKMYVGNVERCLEAVGEGCGWTRLADVRRDSFADYLSARKKSGTAPRTLNNDLATVRTFFAWCFESKRIDSNPCDNLKRVEQADDRRRIRRALSRAECAGLLAVAGPRELVYRVALGSGLRRRELKLLQWRDVAIDDEARPCLRLRAEATKSKRADVIPIALELAGRLRVVRPENYSQTEPVFRLGRTRTLIPTFSTWLADLGRAKVEYKAADGSILGFHSLRVTYVTELQKAGLPPRTVMQLARHTDYRVTDQSYTDMRLIDTFGAVHALPTYESEPGLAVALLTGTDNRPVGEKSQDQIRDQKSFTHRQNGALSCSQADNRKNQCQSNGTLRKSRIHHKNRGFMHAGGAKEKAEHFGLSTGVLGIEPRTF